MLKVAASEMQREFGRYRDMALDEPLVVVEEGRQPVVVLSEAEFERLRLLTARSAYFTWELPDDVKLAIEQARPPESSKQHDHEMDG